MPQNWTKLSYAPINEQIPALEAWILSHPDLMAILELIRAWNLPDGWLVAGAIYQSLWNEITDQPPQTGIKDYDIIYFDGKDLSYEGEDRLIQRANLAGEVLGLALELRNQARVHLWFEAKFGFAVPPLSCSLEALNRYASTSHAVAARLKDNGRIEIAAPYGLSDIFSLYIRPNKRLPNGPSHNAKAKRFLEHWPQLTVEWA